MTIQNKWVFKIKVKANGLVDRFKSKLVVKGYSQIYGLDYDETYTPIAKADNIRTLLSLAAIEDCDIV